MPIAMTVVEWAISVLVVVAVVTPVAFVVGRLVRLYFRRNAILREARQLPGVVTSSVMVDDGVSESWGDSSMHDSSRPHHVTEGAPTMAIRVEVRPPGESTLQYEETIKVGRLDLVAPGAPVTVFYVRDDPTKTTIAPDGYLASPSGSRLAFEPSPVSVVAVQPRAGDDHAEALARLSRLRDDGALTEAEFEAARRRLGAG